MMALTPVIFIVGPSGVGKSEVAKWIEADLEFLHFDIDRRNGFGANNLRDEWHRFSTRLDVSPLAACLRERTAAARRNGAVLSFPSTRILTSEQIDIAMAAGICTRVLWGSEEHCRCARRARELANGRILDEGRYEKRNREAFNTYGRPEYSDLRVAAFQVDGSRWSREHMITMIQRQITG